MNSTVSESIFEVTCDVSEVAGIVELDELQLSSVGGGIADIIGV